ncbi:MAG: HlyD family secretion protein [Planctomycetota bacterium]
MNLTPGLNLSSAALQMVQTSRWNSRLAKCLAACFAAGPILLVFVPWTQNVAGQGRVIAYAPLERQQEVEAPIAGRIVDWHVQEGSVVRGGDALLEISDIDPNLTMRLEQEKSALMGKFNAYTNKVESYEQQIQSLEATRDLAVSVASLRLETQKQRVLAAGESLAARLASRRAAEAQFERKQNLLKDGIASQREFEVAERDLEVARTTVNSARAALRAAENDSAALAADLNRVREAADAKISSARATQDDARGQMADARASLAKIEVQLARQRSQVVTAPRDGTVFRLVANQGGEIVKAGDPLLVLVPRTEDRAVEMWLDGNDAPLIAKGDNVRLQFEGWPAVQFAGWPAVAVGTFSGRVSLIDQTDDGKGRFRIVIVPDESDGGWPEVRFLRQGVRAKGWVLLKEVSLGYEFWRQLNGFPPVVASEAPEGDLARKRVK